VSGMVVAGMRGSGRLAFRRIVGMKLAKRLQ